MRRFVAVPGPVDPRRRPVKIFVPVRHGALKAALFAGAGYAGALVVGWFASSRMSLEGSFADLALAALTVLVLAPLAGLLGAAVGFLPYRRLKLSKDDAVWFWAAAAVVVLMSGVESLWLGVPSSLTSALMGSTALMVMRVALIERRHTTRLSDWI